MFVVEEGSLEVIIDDEVRVICTYLRQRSATYQKNRLSAPTARTTLSLPHRIVQVQLVNEVLKINPEF